MFPGIRQLNRSALDTIGALGAGLWNELVFTSRRVIAILLVTCFMCDISKPRATREGLRNASKYTPYDMCSKSPMQ